MNHNIKVPVGRARDVLAAVLSCIQDSFAWPHGLVVQIARAKSLAKMCQSPIIWMAEDFYFYDQRAGTNKRKLQVHHTACLLIVILILGNIRKNVPERNYLVRKVESSIESPERTVSTVHFDSTQVVFVKDAIFVNFGRHQCSRSKIVAS